MVILESSTITFNMTVTSTLYYSKEQKNRIFCLHKDIITFIPKPKERLYTSLSHVHRYKKTIHTHTHTHKTKTGTTETPQNISKLNSAVHI